MKIAYATTPTTTWHINTTTALAPESIDGTISVVAAMTPVARTGAHTALNSRR